MLQKQIQVKADSDLKKFEFIKFPKCANYVVLREDFGNDASDAQFRKVAVNFALGIKSAMLCGEFYGIVLVDNRDRYLGLFKRDRFRFLAAQPLLPHCVNNGDDECNRQTEAIAEQVARSELGLILKSPSGRHDLGETVKFPVQETELLVDIVKSEDFAQTDIFAVVDRYGEFKGLLPKSIIFDQITISLFH